MLSSVAPPTFTCHPGKGVKQPRLMSPSHHRNGLISSRRLVPELAQRQVLTRFSNANSLEPPPIASRMVLPSSPWLQRLPVGGKIRNSAAVRRLNVHFARRCTAPQTMPGNPMHEPASTHAPRRPTQQPNSSSTHAPRRPTQQLRDGDDGQPAGADTTGPPGRP